MSNASDPIALKRELRRRIRAISLDSEDRKRWSEAACERLVSLPSWEAAATVMVFVAMADEVDTTPLIDRLLRDRKRRTVVPYCVGDRLRLFELRSWGDLAEGTFGILEPLEALRTDESRRVAPAAVDLVVTPGMAFDARGGRLGRGRGFYDRFLLDRRSDAVLVGLTFEQRVLDAIPMSEHDVAVDIVVTERRILA